MLQQVLGTQAWSECCEDKSNLPGSGKPNESIQVNNWGEVSGLALKDFSDWSEMEAKGVLSPLMEFN